MDEGIVNILKSHGCGYMADDHKEMIEEIEAYVKNREEQLTIPVVSRRKELLIEMKPYNAIAVLSFCREFINDIHTKGKHIGYETAIKEVDLRVQNALDMKDEHIS